MTVAGNTVAKGNKICIATTPHIAAETKRKDTNAVGPANVAGLVSTLIPLSVITQRSITSRARVHHMVGGISDLIHPSDSLLLWYSIPPR